MYPSRVGDTVVGRSFAPTFTEYTNPLLGITNSAERLPATLYTQAVALALTVVPHRLAHTYVAMPLPRSFADARMLLPLLTHLCMAALCASSLGACIRQLAGRSAPSGWPWFRAWLLAVFLISLLPSAHLLLDVGFLVAERALFTATWPSSLLLAELLVSQLPRATGRPTACRALFMFAAPLAMASRVWLSIDMWRDEMSLNLHNLVQFPRSNYAAMLGIASSLQREGNMAGAEIAFRVGLRSLDLFNSRLGLAEVCQARYLATHDPRALRCAILNYVHLMRHDTFPLREFETNLGALCCIGEQDSAPRTPSARNPSRGAQFVEGRSASCSS
jgi:hypothetical protein